MSFIFVSLNGATSPGEGDIFTFDVPKSKVTLQCFGGNVGVWLQLSLDGVNFVDIVEATGSGVNSIVTSDGPIALAARARLASVGFGSATAIIAIEPTVTAVDVSQS